MIILSILIHEMGHLFFGLITGYHFLHIEILGISFEKTGGHYRVRRYKNISIGQCMMYTDNENKNPAFFICGGIIANLITGMGMFITACCSATWLQGILFFVLGSINIFIALYNAFLGSKTSDGNTLREITGPGKNIYRIYFNRIMSIAKYLREGKSYSDMPEELFAKDMAAISPEDKVCLGREMETYRYRFHCERGEVKWIKNLAEEPVAGLVSEAYAEYLQKELSAEEIFESVLGKSKRVMYPGEYLSAARCFISMIKRSEKSGKESKNGLSR